MAMTGGARSRGRVGGGSGAAECADAWSGAGLGWCWWMGNMGESWQKNMGTNPWKNMEKHGEHLKIRKKCGKSMWERPLECVSHVSPWKIENHGGNHLLYINIYIYISINLDESYRPHRDITGMMYVSELLGLRCQHGQLENQPFHSRIFPASHVWLPEGIHHPMGYFHGIYPLVN